MIIFKTLKFEQDVSAALVNIEKDLIVKTDLELSHNLASEQFLDHISAMFFSAEQVKVICLISLGHFHGKN